MEPRVESSETSSGTRYPCRGTKKTGVGARMELTTAGLET